VREARLREGLLDAHVPDAGGAEERGLRLVRAAYAAKPPALRPRHRAGVRRGLQVAVAAGLLAVLISPAGAAVRHWVRDTVGPAREPAAPALTSLPAPGSLLVDSAKGPWVVHEDGSKRLLGAYRQSTWSPHGLFVAVTGAGQLLAVDPEGGIRWALTRPGSVRDPAWSPDGYRIAYLNADTLRVVAADGTGDRSLVRPVAQLAPAWRPGGGHVLAFARRGGSVEAIDADSGAELFATAPGPRPTRLAWSPDGSRLLVADPLELRLFDRAGRLVWSRAAPAGREFGATATVGGGRIAAILSARSEPRRSELLLLGPRVPEARLFAGPGTFSGVEASPDRRWLLLSWSSADQWLFLDLAHPQRVAAVAGISEQFAPGTTSPSPFPAVAGWCCTPTS
jgi:dipeptidyl aminopeptidase/acylaminoacyl peptidase